MSGCVPEENDVSEAHQIRRTVTVVLRLHSRSDSRFFGSKQFFGLAPIIRVKRSDKDASFNCHLVLLPYEKEQFSGLLHSLAPIG